MNFGDRKMQMSSAAVPAMRTSPIRGQLSGAAAACRLRATTSRPTPRDAFKTTVSPGR